MMGEAHEKILANMQSEIERLTAELAVVLKDRDNWKAHAVSRGKRLRQVSDRFSWIARELEDEGDRVYFGSSNYADDFKREVAWLDDFAWDKIMGEPEDWDLLGALENARTDLAAERERVKHLERVVGCHDLLKQNADALTDNERLRAELAAERERREAAEKMLYGTKDVVSTTGVLEEAASFQQAWGKAERKVTKLREALVPFAKAARNFDGMNVKNTEEWFAYAGQASADGHSGSITVGDLRRARAVLAETKGAGDE